MSRRRAAASLAFSQFLPIKVSDLGGRRGREGERKGPLQRPPRPASLQGCAETQPWTLNQPSASLRTPTNRVYPVTFLGVQSHRGQLHPSPWASKESRHRALIKWVPCRQWMLLPCRCSDSQRGQGVRGREGGHRIKRDPTVGGYPDLHPLRGAPIPRQRAARVPVGPAPSDPAPAGPAHAPPSGALGSRRGPGDSGARRRGRSMGRFRGGLRCIKYLLLGFNLLFWVSPELAGPRRAGPGRVAGSGLGSPGT